MFAVHVGVCARMRLCMAVCVRAPFVQQGSIATITTTMRPFAAVAVALTLCVSVCWRFYCSTQHTRTLTHTQSTPVFQWTPSQVPLHSYDEIACGKMCNSRTRPHAHPHPHLALSFPYLAATPPSSSSFFTPHLSFISHLWLPFSACCKMTNFTLCPH